MGTQQFFALFGESPFMDTVETFLADVPQVGIVRIHPSVTDLACRLLSFEPDMVIIDLNAPSLHFVVPFMKEQPGVPVLGLDLPRSQAILLTGQLYTAPTSDHLLAIVERYVSDQAHTPSLTARVTTFSVNA
jgi:hypothetical protein